jgi:hypothetical protein
MRHLLLLAGLATIASVPAGAQTVIDETLATVNGQVIMASDVRQARQLKLVRIGDASDAAILFELENRVLELAQVGRSALPDPSADEVKSRRQEWEASLGPGVTPAALLAGSGMKDADLTTWLRDDVRIQKYLKQLFGSQADPAAAIGKWILDLRKRAGLK